MGCEGFQFGQRKVVFRQEESCGVFSTAGAFVLDLADVPAFTARGAIRTARAANTSGWPGTPKAVRAEQGWSLTLPAELHMPEDVPFPAVARLLIASGFAADHDPGTKRVILTQSARQALVGAPVDLNAATDVEPFSMSVADVQRDAVQKNVRGATFSTTVELNRGQPAIFRFEGLGLKVTEGFEVAAPVSAAAFNALGLETLRASPLVFLGAELELTGTGTAGESDEPIGVEALSIAFNQNVSEKPNPRDKDGFAPSFAFFGGDSVPTVDIRFDQTSHNVIDTMRRLQDQETISLRVRLQGNGVEVPTSQWFEIRFPALQYSGVASADRSGARAYQCTLEATNPDTDGPGSVAIEYQYGEVS